MTILYPTFIICANICTDNFWRRIFDNLSQGHCPYGVSISDTTVLHSNFSFRYKGYEPDELYKKIKSLFQKELNFKNEDITFFKWGENEWKNIRKTKLKETIVANYVIKIGDKYNIPLEKQKKIFSAIKTALVCGDIDTDDIEYTDGKIINIKNLDMNSFSVSRKFGDKIGHEKPLLLSKRWKLYVKKINREVGYTG